MYNFLKKVYNFFEKSILFLDKVYLLYFIIERLNILPISDVLNIYNIKSYILFPMR